ncbi:MAG: hypothetical protein FWG05_04895, partial [Kiritimatiellaeota bacterium]|nr:hypothetical protein [Kiritimatiellota bacterium]
SDFSAQLFSWLMFCALPGLTFRVLRGFGARARHAVKLMWILPPSIAVAVTQAGGGGNDLASLWFGALTLALALNAGQASDQSCGCRENGDGRVGDPPRISRFPLLPLVCSAAVLTNIKTSNSFFLIPIAFYILRLLFARKIKLRLAEAIVCVALFIAASAIPTFLRNHNATGAVSGQAESAYMPEFSYIQMEALFNSSFAALVSDAIQPPVFPGGEAVAAKWNNTDWARRTIPPGSDGTPYGFRFFPVQSEECAGMGIAWLVMLAIPVLTALASKIRARFRRGTPGESVVFDKTDGSASRPRLFAWGFAACAIAAMISMCSGGFLPGFFGRFGAPYWYAILVCAWAVPMKQMRLSMPGIFVYLCAFALALLVPTRMIIPDAWFVKGSALVSEEMGERAESVAFAYRHHGREFMRLTPRGFKGRLAFLSGHSAYSAYWRTGDSIRFNDWREVTPVWFPDASILDEDAMIIASPVLKTLGYSDIETLASSNNLEIAASKKAIFRSTDGKQDVWFLRRRP